MTIVGSKKRNEDIVSMQSLATVLEYKDLTKAQKRILKYAEPGEVPNLKWPGKRGLEAVWKCVDSYNYHLQFHDSFTQSKFDWLLVEVNLLCRRTKPKVRQDGDLGRIPFFCKYCGKDTKEKGELGWHLKQNKCPKYDSEIIGPLKMYPIYGARTQDIFSTVFRRLGISIPMLVSGGQWEETNDGEEEADVEDSEGEVEDFEEEEDDDIEYDIGHGSAHAKPGGGLGQGSRTGAIELSFSETLEESHFQAGPPGGKKRRLNMGQVSWSCPPT